MSKEVGAGGKFDIFLDSVYVRWLPKGSFKSVFVFRILRVALTIFLVKISQRYLGAMLLKHLKIDLLVY